MNFASPGDRDTSSLVTRSTANGSWEHSGSDGNAANLNHNTGGFIAGIDILAFDTWRLGLLAGYSHTTFNVKDLGSSDSRDNYSLNLRIGLGYTWHDLETIRSILFQSFSDKLKADYHAGTFQILGITCNTGLDELYSASFCKLPRIIVLGVMSATCLPNHHSHLTILLAKTKSMSVKCFFWRH